MVNLELFADDEQIRLPNMEKLGEQAVWLRRFALSQASELMQAIHQLTAVSPFRHMQTPNGYEMSVAMTNCGQLGWVTDRQGYRYQPVDPLTQNPWPAMPAVFLELATSAAQTAGFENFIPDACLINQYSIGSRLSLHQDKNETDFTQPVVSVSLGIPAMFVFGGFSRQAASQKVMLQHGDVVVWGGVDRLRYHAVLPLKPAFHPLTGEQRINFTFRRAG